MGFLIIMKVHCKGPPLSFRKLIFLPDCTPTGGKSPTVIRKFGVLDPSIWWTYRVLISALNICRNGTGKSRILERSQICRLTKTESVDRSPPSLTLNGSSPLSYHTTPYHTALHHTTPHRTAQHRTIPHRTVQHHTTHTTPYHTAPYHTPPHRTAHHTIPHNTIPPLPVTLVP